jgi:hypothetical protein
MVKKWLGVFTSWSKENTPVRTVAHPKVESLGEVLESFEDKYLAQCRFRAEDNEKGLGSNRIYKHDKLEQSRVLSLKDRSSCPVTRSNL